jgi:drug/metabolite transporter (DMT)-like permease
MALGSAAAVAVLITLISRSSVGRPAAASAGIQLGLAALFVSPMLAFGVGSPEQVLSLMAVGGALLGPGFLLYWIGMRKSDATTAGIIGLNQVLVASLLVGLMGSGGITPATAIAGALIVIAVGLERFSLRGVC